MKRILKISFFAIIIANLFLTTSCEENLQVSCAEFSVSVDYTIVDTSHVTLTANPLGGVPVYTYSWSTGASTQSIDVTEEDTYTVTVTDGNDCTASIDFVVDTTSIDTLCADFSAYMDFIQYPPPLNDSLLAVVSGGTQPYSFIWSTGETDAQIFTPTSGFYLVTITDANGCIITTGAQHLDICDNLQATIDFDIDPMTFDTTLTANVVSGSAPYTYSWSTGDMTETIQVLGNGTYSVTITDDEGCELELSYDYEFNTDCLSLMGEITLILDTMPMDTLLVAEVTGGTEPYDYLWSFGAITQSAVVPYSGLHSVIVTDAAGCVITLNYFYTPWDICNTFDVTISDSIDPATMDVILTANPVNGNPGYTFEWSNAEISQTINVGQSTGTFGVTVTDSEGCMTQESIEL